MSTEVNNALAAALRSKELSPAQLKALQLLVGMSAAQRAAALETLEQILRVAEQSKMTPQTLELILRAAGKQSGSQNP